MAIYIVKFFYCDWDQEIYGNGIEGSFIEGVFSSEEKAKDYINNRQIPQEYIDYYCSTRIIEWELDEPIPFPEEL